MRTFISTPKACAHLDDKRTGAFRAEGLLYGCHCCFSGLRKVRLYFCRRKSLRAQVASCPSLACCTSFTVSVFCFYQATSKKTKRKRSTSEDSNKVTLDMFNCPPYFSNIFKYPQAGRTDETSRALEQKREMVDQIQDMQRKVKNEQIGKAQNKLLLLTLSRCNSILQPSLARSIAMPSATLQKYFVSNVNHPRITLKIIPLIGEMPVLISHSTGTLDITRDMTRQYKGMQEELLNRINQLEGTIQARTCAYACARV